jgi:hypothetical protein
LEVSGVKFGEVYQKNKRIHLTLLQPHMFSQLDRNTKEKA